jgi:ligand-binding sensor domain-containing protein
MRGRVALAVVLLGLASPARALDPRRAITEYSLDVWRIADGLPQNTVQNIVQTRDGYLWLATQEGLVRYNGLSFTVFDTSNSAIPRNFIESLYEARDGALWFGTFHGGITRYSGGTFRTFTTRDGLSANGATAIAEEPDGTLWFATLDAGLNRYQNGQITVYRVAQGLPDDRVLSLHCTRDGSLWIGTESGLARWRDGRFTVFTRKDGLPDDVVTALAEGHDGCVWIGTRKGLSCFRQGRFTSYGARKGLPNAEIQVLRVDPAGVLWIGTGGGLSRFHDGEFQAFTSREGLAQDIVLALAYDREGSLWIGTDGGGLNRLKDGKVVTYVSRDPRWQPAANTVVGDGQGGLWVGAYGGQIDRLQGGAFTILPSDPLKQSIVRAVARDGNDLWIGTELGLSLYHAGRFEFFSGRDGLPVTSVRAILLDRHGALWVGTDGNGVARRQGRGFVLYGEREGLAGNRVRVIHEDRQGRLWIGTYGGLSLFQDGRFTNFGAAQGLSDPLVRSLYDDAAGALWVGTFGGGLFRLRDGRFDAWTMREGLTSDIVYGITEDASGHLWMSCNRGIFRVAKAELEAVASGNARAVHPRLFGVGDGMKSSECNGGNPALWKDEQGGLFFPTIDGVVRVDPDRLPRNEVPPSVVVEQVLADGRPLETGGGVTVPPGRPRVEIRFAGVSFLAPERMEMAYRLEGFDRDWIDAGARRVATYTNLPPRRYTFHVRASNEDGVAATDPAPLALRVEPRFYETGLFLAACAGVLALAGFGAHRLRVAGLKRQERELKEKVADGLASVKVLSGLLPVCASCKNIRDDKGYWSQIETYIHDHSEAQFSHGICPDCARRLYPEQAERVLGRRVT